MASTRPSSRKSLWKQVVTIGIDLAKSTVHFVGLDADGCVLTRHWYSKGRLLDRGHDVKLMRPNYVQPFVKRDKNDSRETETCAEACLRPPLRFVPVKTEA